MPTPKVLSFVAATYVRDLDKSRAFYYALGFTEGSAGRNELSAWSSLQHDSHAILLVTSTPAMDIPRLPLLFYFYVDDLASAMKSLEQVGGTIAHVGYPPHAPGGEVRTLDPDGNTVLLGQRDQSENPPNVPHNDPAERFSLLKEAAALARHRAGPQTTCQVGNTDGPCTRAADVKLADSWGNTAWACITHAEEALISAPGSFIANHDDRGLEPFLTNRHTR